MDSEFSWTLFFKWANSTEHLLRVNPRGHFLVNFCGISSVKANFRGHILGGPGK